MKKVLFPRMEPLKGYTFVFTGELSIDRELAQSKVILLGGRVTTAPSGRTNYLVAGNEPGPSKIKKAKSLGIKIISEEEFNGLVQMNSQGGDDIKTFNEENTQTKKEDTDATKEDNKKSTIWAEKYRPKSTSEILGNNKEIYTLKTAISNKVPGILISGDPGIGKTTAAILSSKECGYEVIELNASDLRNKNMLQNTFKGISYKTDRKKIIIMDEIDGMFSDRGGIAELISIIKNTKNTIICISNDRSNIKLRPLYNLVDIRFKKPNTREILQAIKKILKEENKEIKDNIIMDIISKSDGDLRYTLNNIQNISLGKKTITFQKRNVIKNIFTILQELYKLNRKQNIRVIDEKINMYFLDYDLVPLMVQENYVEGSIYKIKDMADDISMGDIVDGIRRTTMDWSLLPLHGFFSTALPTQTVLKKIEFTKFLGKLSSTNKNKRVINKIFHHLFKVNNSSIEETMLYYFPVLNQYYITQMTHGDTEDIINLLLKNFLLKEDLDEIYTLFRSTIKFDSKIKSKLTREYKKIERKLPYEIEEREEIND
ncbi:DNA replication factor C subunit [Spraguea lophii 42_110]|uniref:Replication factor C subunit 1 n=1 Tax=Spraguea lophii (strain 42_110) TaxID=1358809 RepID=S7WC70_SPRLO|nr:DNA replication factor C subunit [Spraguea lophii 42_110]